MGLQGCAVRGPLRADRGACVPGREESHALEMRCAGLVWPSRPGQLVGLDQGRVDRPETPGDAAVLAVGVGATPSRGSLPSVPCALRFWPLLQAALQRYSARSGGQSQRWARGTSAWGTPVAGTLTHCCPCSALTLEMAFVLGSHSFERSRLPLSMEAGRRPPLGPCPAHRVPLFLGLAPTQQGQCPPRKGHCATAPSPQLLGQCWGR